MTVGISRYRRKFHSTQNLHFGVSYRRSTLDTFNVCYNIYSWELETRHLIRSVDDGRGDET